MQKAARRTGTRNSKQRKETQKTTKHQTLAKKTCEDFLNVSSFHGQVKARD